MIRWIFIGAAVFYFCPDLFAETIPLNSAAVKVTVSEAVQAQANRLENEGLQLIDLGKRQEGLALMKKAIDLDPQSFRYMNYGSILFGKGVEFYKSGQPETGLKVLRESEEYLLKAADSFDEVQEATLLSQAYFLLGEIYHFALKDDQKAKEYYTRAVSYYDHPGALSALEQFSK